MSRHAALPVAAIVLALTARLAAQNGKAMADSATSIARAEGVYTLGQARRGAEVARLCTACHGLDLDGSVDRAPTLVGPEFAAKWDGWTLGDMFERIVAEIRTLTRHAAAGDATGLAEDRESKNRQQSADVLAFILLANRLPAGPTELPANIELLRRIPFRAR